MTLRFTFKYWVWPSNFNWSRQQNIDEIW